MAEHITTTTGAAALGAVVVGNAIADHATGTAFYQRSWDDLLDSTEPVEFHELDEPTDDELARWADLDGIELDERIALPDDLVIEPAPEWLDAVLYGSDDDDDHEPRVPSYVLDNLRSRLAF